MTEERTTIHCWMNQISKHDSLNLHVAEGFSTDFKSSNRIELSQLGPDLLNFTDLGGSPLWVGMKNFHLSLSQPLRQPPQPEPFVFFVNIF